MNKKIMVTEKFIADLISHNGCGKKVYNIKTDVGREAMIASIIFKEGKNFDDGKGPSVKDLTDKLRAWFKTILGCIHHRPSTNSSEYINTTQKFVLFFLERGFKLALPAILFKFLRDWIRETITRILPKRGRLILDILVENGLVEDLLVNGLTVELVKDDRKLFWGKNLKSMGLISKVVNPDYLPTKEDICGTWIHVDNFPIFTKIDPPYVLAYYLDSCVEEGINPLVDPFNFPYTFPDAYGKRKKDVLGEGSFGLQKKKMKVSMFMDEDEVPLNEP